MPSVTDWLPGEATALLKVFFIPSSTSWHRFQSELFRQVFLLFFNLKMTTLLSQRARSPRLLENWWHCSRRHFYFKELNRSWAANMEHWNPFKTFSFFFFLFHHQAILAIMPNGHHYSIHASWFGEELRILSMLQKHKYNMLRMEQQGIFFFSHLNIHC